MSKIAFSDHPYEPIVECTDCPYYVMVTDENVTPEPVGAQYSYIDCMYVGGPTEWRWNSISVGNGWSFPSIHPQCPAPRVPDSHALTVVIPFSNRRTIAAR